MLPLPVIVESCGQEATPEFSPGFATHHSVLDTGHVPWSGPAFFLGNEEWSVARALGEVEGDSGR